MLAAMFSDESYPLMVLLLLPIGSVIALISASVYKVFFRKKPLVAPTPVTSEAQTTIAEVEDEAATRRHEVYVAHIDEVKLDAEAAPEVRRDANLNWARGESDAIRRSRGEKF